MTIATVMRDCYRWDDRKELYSAMVELFPNGDWHASGVYSFWDPDSNNLLYLGITDRLPTRFAQHNGVTGRGRTAGNKYAKIREWFDSHETIGYSVYAQSALSMEGRDLAVLAEGQLLEAYLAHYRALPPWNQIGASIDGRQYATQYSMGHLEALTGRGDGLVVARKTLRQLANDTWSNYLESVLHCARMSAVDHNIGTPYGDEEILREIHSWINNPMVAGTNTGFIYLAEARYWELPTPHPERHTA